jgi:hypothetical protein
MRRRRAKGAAMSRLAWSLATGVALIALTGSEAGADVPTVLIVPKPPPDLASAAECRTAVDAGRSLDDRALQRACAKAGASGDPFGRRIEAMVWLSGKGPSGRRDEGIALKNLREAAGGGDAVAQATLGTMLANGAGAPADRVAGHAWLSIAIDRLADGALRTEARERRRDVEDAMRAGELAKAQSLRAELAETVKAREDARREAQALGLTLRRLALSETVKSGAPFLRLEGNIANVAPAPRPLPAILCIAYDAADRELKRWSVPPPKDRLEPGESVWFAADLAAPPRGAKRMNVAFDRPG